uniref:Putative cuticle protein n=1 Tax=Manduca sexta TaxID=7130 RepID=Q9U502_MANSE|nr:putative cuticle protein [Manduca sexta]
MKYAVVFLLVCVAMAAAAPQLLGWPGYAAGYIPYAGSRTLVAGPTVVNGGYGFGGRFIAPGYVGPAFI